MADDVGSREAEMARDVARESIGGIRWLGVEVPVDVDDATPVLRDGDDLLVRCVGEGMDFMHHVSPRDMPLR